MTFPDVGQLMSGALGQMRETMRQTAISALLLMLSVIILLTAAGFGIAALYLHLSSIMLPFQAAGLIALGLLALAILMLVITLRRGQTNQPSDSHQTAPSSPPARSAIDDCAEAASDMVRQNPTSTVITALVAGAVFGLIKPRS